MTTSMVPVKVVKDRQAIIKTAKISFEDMLGREQVYEDHQHSK